jgi:hypothetical protein
LGINRTFLGKKIIIAESFKLTVGTSTIALLSCNKSTKLFEMAFVLIAGAALICSDSL